MNADKMREILGSHPDFQIEVSRIERLTHKLFFPKYHCELNERVWAQAKRYYCNYSIVSLRKNVVPPLESVPLESIQKYFMTVRHYIFACLYRRYCWKVRA